MFLRLVQTKSHFSEVSYLDALKLVCWKQPLHQWLEDHVFEESLGRKRIGQDLFRGYDEEPYNKALPLGRLL